MSMATVVMLGIRRYLRFDAPLLHFLGKMTPASSARDSPSALRDGSPGAAAGSSVPFIASNILVALIVACGAFPAASTEHLFRSLARSLVIGRPSSSPSPVLIDAVFKLATAIQHSHCVTVPGLGTGGQRTFA